MRVLMSRTEYLTALSKDVATWSNIAHDNNIKLRGAN
jgi:hypothetical protein